MLRRALYSSFVLKRIKLTVMGTSEPQNPLRRIKLTGMGDQ